MIPKTNIPKIAKRYPRRFVSYATIENDTESQCGHLTFYDLNIMNKLVIFLAI